jgi:hypothetical protein
MDSQELDTEPQPPGHNDRHKPAIQTLTAEGKTHPTRFAGLPRSGTFEAIRTRMSW